MRLLTITLVMAISLLTLTYVCERAPAPAPALVPGSTRVPALAPVITHAPRHRWLESKEPSEFLDAMKEPSLRGLAEVDRSLTAYRFLWLPSFHKPVSVRVVMSKEGASLHVVQLDGSGGHEPGKIAMSKSLALSQGQREELSRRLDESRYWSLPSVGNPDLITDGDSLIFEAIQTGKYHVVERHCPEPGAYVDLCRFMLDLAGLEVLKVWNGYRK
jgi:hypothetical protein